MSIAVIMPVVLQNPATLQMTLNTLASVRADMPIPWSLGLLCNRLHVCTAAELEQYVRGVLGEWPGLEIVVDRERTVAGAWNEGARRAIAGGASRIILMANDARPLPGCFKALLAYDVPDVALWSACQEPLASQPGAATDGADFSLFMVRPETFARHGWFDENYRPAYFEDNDMYARVILGGEHCRVIHDAKFTHVSGGSQTIRLDAEMAHHVQHWFQSNADYFRRKWGRMPANTEEEIRTTYYQTPFNVPGRPLSWWELEPGRS